MDNTVLTRSFALRGGRMNDTRRRALNELYPILAAPENPEDWEEFYRPYLRRILEIGFGTGEATVAMAEAHPDWGLIGLEVYPPGVAKVIREIKVRELKNLRVCRADALQLLPKIPANLLDGVHVYFPDPWPKVRHRRRRLVQEGFLKAVAFRLRPGGYLHFVTDWEDYAQGVRDLVRRDKGWAFEGEDWSPPRPWRPSTKFEKRARLEGRNIFEVFCRILVVE